MQNTRKQPFQNLLQQPMWTSALLECVEMDTTLHGSGSATCTARSFPSLHGEEAIKVGGIRSQRLFLIAARRPLIRKTAILIVVALTIIIIVFNSSSSSCSCLRCCGAAATCTKLHR